MGKKSPIGMYIKALRQKKQWSQEDLAREITAAGYPCSDQAISHWENGHSLPPRTTDGIRIFAQVLGTTPAEYLDKLGYFDSIPPERLNEIAKKLPGGLVALMEKATAEQLELIARIAKAVLAQDEEQI